MNILIATKNKGKIKEIREIFTGTKFELMFLDEMEEKIIGINIQENAKSFEGNALIKALVYGERTGMVTLGDDSGLCVDALEGEPGVISARYSEEGTDKANNQKLLEKMKGVETNDRNCYYNTTVAIYDPRDNWVKTVKGQWYGRIASEPRGEKSFGYAPIFMARDFDYKKTNAEMDPSELIEINHRGKAFREAIKVLEKKYKITI